VNISEDLNIPIENKREHMDIYDSEYFSRPHVGEVGTQSE
jgi:hypothetical protein